MSKMTEAILPTSTTLGDQELEWARYQPLLEQRGYMLRRRYRPGWVPDVLTTGKTAWDCEDAIPAWGEVLDATRISDGAPVVLKIVPTFSPDTRISWFLTNEPGAEKHALPCLELIPMYAEFAFMVMPRMRDCSDPPYFETVREFMEFLEQVLELSSLLIYLHSKNIAHRDICTNNIVVDPSQTIPGGAHFSAPHRTSDGVTLLAAIDPSSGRPYMQSRTQAGPMKYYFIDFGLSVRFPPGVENRELVTGEYGRLRSRVPEISATVPYDAFKVDVRLVGEMLRHEFLSVYTGLDYIVPLVRKLRRRDPARRPDAAGALVLFRALVSGLSEKEMAGTLSELFYVKDRRRRRAMLFMKGLGLR
ncbi:hypothetical protein C8R44DRAFT_884648 [Mycena epipterygia]|nr:hypothetical protein C8R44DRAFT_884648 [Mycena epipterygia]